MSIEGVPHKNKDSCNLSFVIEKGTQVEYDHGKMSGLTLCRQDESNTWTWDVGYVVVSTYIYLYIYMYTYIYFIFTIMYACECKCVCVCVCQCVSERECVRVC